MHSYKRLSTSTVHNACVQWVPNQCLLRDCVFKQKFRLDKCLLLNQGTQLASVTLMLTYAYLTSVSPDPNTTIPGRINKEKCGHCRRLRVLIVGCRWEPDMALNTRFVVFAVWITVSPNCSPAGQSSHLVTKSSTAVICY